MPEKLNLRNIDFTSICPEKMSQIRIRKKGKQHKIKNIKTIHNYQLLNPEFKSLSSANYGEEINNFSNVCIDYPPFKNFVSKYMYKYARHVWLLIFIPALLHFIYIIRADRNEVFSILRLSHPYYELPPVIHTPVPSFNFINDTSLSKFNNNNKKIDTIFYLLKDLTNNNTELMNFYDSEIQFLQVSLVYPVLSVMNAVLDSIPYHFSDSTWFYDDKLGRGYLLLSDQYRNGNIWRWEEGGGPFNIGKSLEIRGSGCRSFCYQFCYHDGFNMDSYSNTPSKHLGSSSITVQPTYKAKNWYSGRLIIAELGERQIIRMEEDGTRTSLVTTVPSPCSKQYNQHISNKNIMVRLENVESMIYTPFGDLLFTDRRICYKKNHFSHKSRGVVISSLYRLRGGTLSSSSISTYTKKERNCLSSPININHEEKHKKEMNPNNTLPDLLYHNEMFHILGLSQGIDHNTLYISASVCSKPQGVESNTENDYKEKKYGLFKITLENDNLEYLDNYFSGIKRNTGKSNITVGANPPIEITHDNRTALKRYNDFWNGFLSNTNCIQLVHDLTPYFEEQYYGKYSKMTSTGPAIAVDSIGRIYNTIPGGIIILDTFGKDILAMLPLFDRNNTTVDNKEKTQKILPNSISLGNNGYLYVTTTSSLLQLKVKAVSLSLPTDIALPSNRVCS